MGSVRPQQAFIDQALALSRAASDELIATTQWRFPVDKSATEEAIHRVARMIQYDQSARDEWSTVVARLREQDGRAGKSAP